MRKATREIREFAQVVEVMRRCDVCRLALNGADGVPYLVPLNFGMSVQDEKVTL